MVTDEAPPVAFVRLRPAEVASVHSRPVELAGLVTGLVELGLADIDAVAPQVVGAPVSPALSAALESGGERWNAVLEVGGTRSVLRIALTLCPPDAPCVEHVGEGGTADDPSPAVAAVLRGAATQMVRPVAASAVGDWGVAESRDPYAVLVAGRAAATFYGLREPVPEHVVGDRRRDPVARALVLDPDMPLAGWIAGRHAFARGEALQARTLFGRASLGRPSSVLLLADSAVAWERAQKPEAAWPTWEHVDARAPYDPRFVVHEARAALATGRIREAQVRLDSLDAAHRQERAVAEMRVAVAEATAPDAQYDELLATWQEAAPDDPEPVRRRIRLRVRDDRYAEALDLADALRHRGVPEEAARLQLALAVALEDWEHAATLATELGQPEVADRIRARNGADRSVLSADPDPYAVVMVGWGRLQSGDPAGALAAADQALARRRWLPEALELRAEALEALGRRKEAQQARDRWRQAVPAL